MRVLVYGFGRMGLTHFSILNGLDPSVRFTIIEPNRLQRFILKRNIDAEVFPNDKKLTDGFDLTLVTTPPSSHSQILNVALARGDNRIFVEKPFGGHTNAFPLFHEQINNVNIGYVLRFNPFIQWLKNNVEAGAIESIQGQYLSNTIQKKPEGWRNGKFSGALNEMGSHIIDLIYYLTGEYEFEIISAKTKSIVSDIDDVVEANLKGSRGVNASLNVNWIKEGVRKPVYSLKLVTADGTSYFLDQQHITVYGICGEISRKITITDLPVTVPFYLRGVDFTRQMSDLLGDRAIIATVNDAVKVNRLMNNILNYENNTR